MFAHTTKCNLQHLRTITTINQSNKIETIFFVLILCTTTTAPQLRTKMTTHYLEIISNTELNDKKLDMIRTLNKYYDNWVNSEYYQLTFVEMQHKLMHALNHIKESFENSTGLIQLCKTHPYILLKCPDNQSSDTTCSVSMTLQEMFLDIISNYGDQFTQDDFGTMGGSTTIIMENTRIIDNIVRNCINIKIYIFLTFTMTT